MEIHVSDEKELKNMSYDNIMSEVENSVYALVSYYFETLESQKKIIGNGHHMSQEVAKHVSNLLYSRRTIKTTNDFLHGELLGKRVRSKADPNHLGTITKLNPYPQDRYDSYDITWDLKEGQICNLSSIGCWHGFEGNFMEVVE